MTLPLPGATVELIEREHSCYAILHWGGLTRFLPMTHAVYATFKAVQKEFEDVAAAERLEADRERVRAAIASALLGSGGEHVMAAVAGAGAGSSAP